ncbi:MAG: SDR family NAD(P)-dependent oxidoreductase [Pseudomonadota bacterium]
MHPDFARDYDLTGRVALVTGAGSRGEGIGNGRAAAILLARLGARVGLIDSEAEAAAETARMIEAEGGEALTLPCEVSDALQVAETVAEAAENWGGPEILVNNVGVSGPKTPAPETDPDEWEAALRVNVTAMMLMARQCIPHMRERGRGAIVNLASVAGLQGGHPGLLYPTSKGAVVNMTRAMAAHHGPEGIRVNCVAPGMVHTPMVVAGGMTEERREARRRRSLLQTEGTGWDVGHAVAFLCTDAARWITGAILPVDAGATAGRVPALADDVRLG